MTSSSAEGVVATTAAESTRMVLAVELDNNVWTFLPGQTINGRVVVTKNIWHKVEGLSIRFLGKMEIGCAASAPSGPPQDSLPRSYQQQESQSLIGRITRSRPAQEVVLDQKLNLLHSWKVLKPGRHEFPFTYELPEDTNLPESIKIEGFRVLYEFVVVLRRPRDDYKVYQTPFYVQLRLPDRSPEEMYNFSSPLEVRKEDKIGFCMCCKSGPYGMLFRVPKRIGWIGQDVDFVLEIWNETVVELDCAKIRLIREFKHKKGLESKKRELVSELAGPSVAAGGHEVWATFFRIPASASQTNLTRRETYEINYTLKALIHPLNQSGKTVSIKCPLLVIRGAELEPSDSSSGIGNQVHKESENAAIPPPPPPPTYEEAMGFDNSSTAPLFE